MRCYVIVTGIVFLFLFLTHLARVFAESTAILHEPMIVVTSLLSLGLALWAAVLAKRQP
jgi:Co/Zn/Cd efflux system component